MTPSHLGGTGAASYRGLPERVAAAVGGIAFLPKKIDVRPILNFGVRVGIEVPGWGTVIATPQRNASSFAAINVADLRFSA